MEQRLMADLQEILISKEDLQRRVAELGETISREYTGKEILMVGVLRGAVIFMADLCRAINLPVGIDFMAVSSYGLATTSSGIVKMIKDLDEDIKDKHVLVVEDIIDSGLTLQYLLENLRSRQPASLKVCALLSKPERRKVNVHFDYIGFEVPDAFLVGYGLDFAEKYRNLPCIGILKPEIYR